MPGENGPMYSRMTFPKGLRAPLGSLGLAAVLVGFCLSSTAQLQLSVFGGVALLVLALAMGVGAGWLLVRRWRADLAAGDRLLAALQSGAGDPVGSLADDNLFRPLVEKAKSVIQPFAEEARRAQRVQTDLELRLRMDRAEHKRLEAILGSLSDPVLVVDRYGDLVLANPSAERLLELSQSPVNRDELPKALRNEGLVEVLNESRLRTAASRRRTEEVQLDVDGKPRWYCVTASTVVDEKGESTGAVAVLHDVTRAHDLQGRYADFVSAVSHELKTPLSGIKAYAELLVDGEATEPSVQEELFGVIDAQTDRLGRLIDNLLDLGRIEAGVARLNKEDCTLNDLLVMAADMVEPSAQAKHIVFKQDLSKLHLAVHVDRDMMTQVAINLLSNAVKYTPDGGEVRLCSRLTDGNAEFEVHDTGYGIAADDLEHIFEKFYRVKDRAGEASGTGLGLPLVKQIVEDVHGGFIRVQSTPGKGSCFTVSIPLAH